MLDCLGIRAGEEYVIPKHLHLFRSALVGFGGRKSSGGDKDLILHAPPPIHFQETAHALDLSYIFVADEFSLKAFSIIRITLITFRCDWDELSSIDGIVSRPIRSKKTPLEPEDRGDQFDMDGMKESDIVVPNSGS